MNSHEKIRIHNSPHRIELVAEQLDSVEVVYLEIIEPIIESDSTKIMSPEECLQQAEIAKHV